MEAVVKNIGDEKYWRITCSIFFQSKVFVRLAVVQRNVMSFFPPGAFKIERYSFMLDDLGNNGATADSWAIICS